MHLSRRVPWHWSVGRDGTSVPAALTHSGQSIRFLVRLRRLGMGARIRLLGRQMNVDVKQREELPCIALRAVSGSQRTAGRAR